MKRKNITLEQIAETKNMVLAFAKAAKGRRYRADVQYFLHDFDQNIDQLSNDIREAKLPYGRFREFEIYDPKQRLIHAACFEDRVFHHALMNHAGTVLETAMTPFSYACRPNKGVHRAVKKVQQHLRQYRYYVKIDIAGYFATIPHAMMLTVLQRRFKGSACLQQFERIISIYETSPNCGLPIGSLSSQYFANYYLDALDRLLASSTLVKANLRYMDDIIWWCDNKQEACLTFNMVKQWLEVERQLTVKNNVQIQLSSQGVTYCGFRILQGAIRLSRRRKKRFQQRRRYWEQRYLLGEISVCQLQQAYASVEAITAGTQSLSWRKENLRLHPPLQV